MDRDRLELNPIPPAAADADLPLCLTLVVYDDEAIVAAFWWDELAVHEHSARLAIEDGTLADHLLEEGELGDEAKPGWRWWRVGEEGPWPLDPRFPAPFIRSVGNLGTPADVGRLVGDELANDPEPSWSREQSAEMLIRALPFWGIDDEQAAIIDADPELGSGMVVTELPDEDEEP